MCVSHLARLAALLLFTATALADAVGPPPPPVQPRTSVSRSGRFEVHVDPSQRNGLGPASVVLSDAGEPRWSLEWPFTPLELVVSDRGQVVGLGREAIEVDGWRTSQARVRIVSPAGEVHADDVLEPRGRYGSAPAGLCLIQELRRVVVRFGWLGDRWWVFDLESGARLFDLDAGALQPLSPYDLHLRHEVDPDELIRVMDLVAIPGTALCLVQWQSAANGGIGVRYALLDALLRPVWILEERDAFRRPRDDEADERLMRLQRDGVVALPGPSGFELRVEAGSEVARFEFVRAARAPRGWAVREVLRRDAPLEPKLPLADPPSTIELSPRGLLRLRERGPGPAGAFAVGADGRLYVQDEETNAVHIFDAEGRPLRVLEAKRSDFTKPRSAPPDLLVGARGDVYAQHDTPDSTWTWYDASGKRLGPLELGDRDVVLQSGADRRFTLTSTRWRLRAADGAVLAESDRRPDGRWLQLSAAGGAPDGGLVGLSDSSDSGGKASRDAQEFGPDVLCWYGPEGQPGRVLELSGGSNLRAHRLLVAKEWILLAGWRARIELVRSATGEQLRFELDDPMPRQGSWDPALSPDRTELWWLDGASWTLHRFALPR